MPKIVKLNNGRIWKTQKAAFAHFKAILHRYVNGELVSDATDVSDISALLLAYDNKRGLNNESKIGAGISHFKRQSNKILGWPTDGFWIYRIDGSSIDFSYIEAVKSATMV
jgi:hypothetical protein